MVSVLACFFGEGVVVAGAGGIVYSWSCVSKNLKCGIVEMKLDKLNILQQPYIELCFSAQRSPSYLGFGFLPRLKHKFLHICKLLHLKRPFASHCRQVPCWVALLTDSIAVSVFVLF